MKKPSLTDLRKEQQRSDGRAPTWVRWLIALVAVYAIWILVGFLVIPPVVRSQIVKQLGSRIDRPVELKKLQFNPFTFAVTLDQFAIKERDGSNFAGWNRLLVDFDTASFFRREWRFQRFELDGFFSRIAVSKDGKINFDDILNRFHTANDSKPAEGKPWPLYVRLLSIDRAAIAYRDDSKSEPFSADIGPSSFTLREFHTGGPKQAPGEFSAISESGETLSWRGTLSLAPLKSTGVIELGQLVLKKYSPYYAPLVRFDVLEGRMSASVHYDFWLANQKPAIRLSETQVSLRDIKIAKRGASSPVVTLEKIDISGISASWPEADVTLARVALSGGSVLAQRDDSGVDLALLFSPTTATQEVAEKTAAQAQATPAPKITVAEISVRGMSALLEDHAVPRPTSLQFTDISFDLRNFVSTALETPLPAGFRALFAPAGEVHAAGSISLRPLKADIGLELTNVALPIFSPYVEEFANVRLAKGKLTSALILAAEMKDPEGALNLSAQGDLTVEDFSVFDGSQEEELLAWRLLSIKGLDFASSPRHLAITDLTWTEPNGHFTLLADGSTNIAAALHPTREPSVSVAFPAPDARTSSADNSFPFSLDRFGIERGSFDFSDRTLQPTVHVSLNQVSGQVEGLSSSNLARATVDLQARVEDITPVVITGTINPLTADMFTDLKVTMKGMNLAPIAPYVGKFAGYDLEKGNLSVDIKCRVNRRRVESMNVATLDQFTFGNPTKSPDATKLPVRLAVALLKDASGRMIIDVPVQGSLDDPNFRVGRVVLRVLTNVLTKVATSPFTLLGSMFGSGDKGEDLAFQRFIAGEATPANAEELKKLDVIAKALRERPTLRLEIIGGYDGGMDSPVLRERELELQMRNIIWDDRRAVDPTVTLDQVDIDPQQRLGMIRRLYYKTYPSEKPVRHGPVEEAPTGPVPGQRGNLGAFQHRSTAPASHAAARTAPSVDTVTQPDGSVETTSKVVEVTPPTFEEMKSRLLQRIEVTDDTLRQLATERAHVVQEYLVTRGQIEPERLTLVSVNPGEPGAKGTRVNLRLK